ncbi:MAG: metal ABC transporter permease [Chloroflexi bacterium]|nr:metal ABC transporter permease [Chloroflexota bacterium]
MPEIFTYDFMVRAIIGGALVGLLAPALGVFLVLRRLSLIADSLAHVALMGVAIGLLTRTFAPGVALGTTSLAALAIEQLRIRRMLPGDVALAVVLYCALAIAVVIISVASGFNVDLFGYLFGSVLTMSPTDLWLVAGLAVVVVLFVTFFFSELSQTSFDPDLARTSGVRVNLVSMALAVLTGAAITLSMRVVGVLLVGALIVIPVMASLRVATGLRASALLAMAIGVLSSFIGIVIAYYANIAAGGAVVLVAVGFLIVAFGWSWAKAKLRMTRHPEAS